MFNTKDQYVRCPHCKEIYVDGDLQRKMSNDPMRGIYICKDCNKGFVVIPEVKQIYVYETRKLSEY